ncbi:MAG: hypothetical protein AAFR71_12335 [Pseudomonadota bacterium]
MNNLAFGGILVVGIAMATVGGAQLGSLGEPPFAYDSATSEKRIAWLEGHASTMERRVKGALVSPSGVGASFKLDKTRTDSQRRQITFDIAVSGSGKINHQAFRNFEKAYLERECPRFMRTPLADNNVTVNYSFKRKTGGTLHTVRMSPSTCGRYV